MANAAGEETYTLYSDWRGIAYYDHGNIRVPAIDVRTAFVIRVVDDEIVRTYQEERRHEPLPHDWNR